MSRRFRRSGGIVHEHERRSLIPKSARIHPGVRRAEFVTNEDERPAFRGPLEESVELVGHSGGAIAIFSGFTPSEAGAIVAANSGGLGHFVLYPRPADGHARRWRLQNNRRRTGAEAVEMKLMIADVDQPSWIGKLPAFERSGDALIGDTGKDDEGDKAGDDESDVARAL